MHVGSFLIVEPDDETAMIVAKQCRRLRRASVVATLAAAEEVLAAGRRLTGLITEQDLADGSGLDVLKRGRRAYPMLPLLMLTSNTEPRVINAAVALRAEFIAKPAHRRDIRGFLRRAVAFERVPDARIAWVVDDYVRTRGLSPRETDVLAAAVDGTPRRDIADQIGTTENTIKSCVKSLLRKCDHGNLESVVRDIMRQALEGSASEHTAELDGDSLPPAASTFTIPPGRTRTPSKD
jgi:two-component system response regulator DesR